MAEQTYKTMDRQAINAELQKRGENPADYGNIDEARARLVALDAGDTGSTTTAPAAAEAEDDDADGDTIKVKIGRATRPGTVALFERDPAHPGDDHEAFIWHNPKRKGQTWTVGNTSAVQERLADRRLARA